MAFKKLRPDPSSVCTVAFVDLKPMRITTLCLKSDCTQFLD